MLARAGRGVCEIVAGAALWRCRCRSRGRRSILCIWVAGVAFGSCLEGQDVGAAGVCEIVAGAALWRCRCRSRGRRSILCIWVCVCVAGVAFGSCLEGQDVVARAAGGVRTRGRRSTLAMPLPLSWQALHSVHLGVEMALPKSWQAQHSVHLGVCLCGRAGAAFCASGCALCGAANNLTRWTKFENVSNLLCFVD